MDFFQHQDQARRRTSALVAYYVLAVALIVAAVYLAVAAVFLRAGAGGGPPAPLWNPLLFAWVVGATGAIVLGGTLYKIAQLAQGGEAVARMLGGRPVQANTGDPDERKILNVVEEMAVASGTPMPRVFILDGEDGINAFAAGFTPGDAVVAVTRGCVARLTRDELQGVVAHEFSHIFNGDMRLNIRLLGVLNGILVIALVGYAALRFGGRSAMVSRSRDKDGGRGGAPIALLGLLLMAIGYIGVFFANLIKSAVSRQREFLADASAVQFTRNPLGIAGALKKIGGFTAGSRLRTTRAAEASHFYFANGLSGAWLSLMATHPPLEERIRRLDPAFDAARDRAAAPQEGRAAPPAGPAAGFAADPAEVVARVGAPRVEHLAYARRVLAGLPPEVDAAARDPSGAAAVVCALLLDADAQTRDAQLRQLARQADPAVLEALRRVEPAVRPLAEEARLPLLDLTLTALQDLSLEQYRRFKDDVRMLVAADERIDLFEYALQRMLLRHLDRVFLRARPPAVRYPAIEPLRAVCGELLSCLAYWGADDVPSAERAFARAAARLGAGDLRISPYEASGLPQLDRALEQLSLAGPAVKRAVLDAGVACVASDGRVTVEEAELLRAIAVSLDCPIPPFLPGKAEALPA